MYKSIIHTHNTIRSNEEDKSGFIVNIKECNWCIAYRELRLSFAPELVDLIINGYLEEKQLVSWWDHLYWSFCYDMWIDYTRWLKVGTPRTIVIFQGLSVPMIESTIDLYKKRIRLKVDWPEKVYVYWGGSDPYWTIDEDIDLMFEDLLQCYLFGLHN